MSTEIIRKCDKCGERVAADVHFSEATRFGTRAGCHQVRVVTSATSEVAWDVCDRCFEKLADAFEPLRKWLDAGSRYVEYVPGMRGPKR